MGEANMSVRKRQWVTSKGEQRQAFIVDYFDQQGERHIRTFDLKKDAVAYHATVKVDVGKGVPTREEIRRMLDAAKGRARALLMTAAFTGLRASELRGLRWGDVDLKGGKLKVCQRADRFNEIGAPKSHSSERKLPIG